MWIRKFDVAISLAQEKKEIDRRNLLRPLAFAILFTAISLVLYALGYRGGARGFLVVSTAGVSGQRFVILALGLFGLSFALAVYNQRRDGIFSSRTLLCRECLNPGRSNPEGRCQCGGNLEPFEYFDWVPES